MAELLAVLWVDQQRRYFIGNTEGVINGEPQYRKRWRQAEDDPFAEATKKEIEIPQPKLVETYNSITRKIDHHNKKKQNDLELERYVRTHQWWKRVCLSIFGMIVVDTMNFHQSCSANTDPNPHTWISELATELIDNTLNSTAMRRNYAN